MEIDVPRTRAETEGVNHGIHLNAAGSALMPRCVVDAQIRHIHDEAAHGGYEACQHAETQIARTYAALGELLNCAPEQIALSDSATTSWQRIVRAFAWQPGDRILTGQAEYVSNYITFLQLARHQGVEIVVVPDDSFGQIDVDRLDSLIDSRTRLVALTHVPTNGGLVNPAAEVGTVTRAKGVPYLLDACQSAGQLALDVQAIGCDFLSATGRKYLRGPRGTGFLYIHPDWIDRLEPASLDIRSATWSARDAYTPSPGARKFETFEFNYAAVIGLGTAVDYALSWGMPAIQGRIGWLASTLRRRLERIPGVTIRDLGRETCGICTFTLEGQTAQAVKTALADAQIQVTVSERASTRLDMDQRELDAVVRASVHYYNTEDELDRLCAAITELAPAPAA
ncbi:aminotransferase class V-fold PLP-dependent enzyme [Rhodovibrio salinarum]|uniref:Aminotransferase class V-fold PLP-dependent enzyme n=1 Tax=Rhodovibrio salinarum TaxID=1087 RepID=A0A934QI83_9PROT|nr:aminotransferase class V-fold PLP-dependent enzyme [Rhodovibrio salinarum]MBK1697269.1 aminotransferase class V-fold PLP-dependent enzyme [Rhodovibrio salinarum]